MVAVHFIFLISFIHAIDDKHDMKFMPIWYDTYITESTLILWWHFCQVVERQDKHLKANEQRKLTKEERSAKRDKKLQEDTKYEIHSAAFWVKDLTHNLNKKKV